MLPIRWDPLRELNTFHRDLDHFFRRSFGLLRGEEEVIFTPTINAYIQGNEYCVEAEIPGVDKKDLDVSVEGNVLSLRGERKLSREAKEEDFVVKESQYGSFSRQLALPEGADTENVSASYENGILKISMPIAQKAITGRHIEIQAPEERGRPEEGRQEAAQMH